MSKEKQDASTLRGRLDKLRGDMIDIAWSARLGEVSDGGLDGIAIADRLEELVPTVDGLCELRSEEGEG